MRLQRACVPRRLAIRNHVSRPITLLIAISCAFGSACGARVPRADPYVWQLRGAVVSVTDSRLQVRHKTGGIVDLQIDDHTAYLRNKRPDSRQSLGQGSRVMVEVETIQSNVYRARVVEIFGGRRAE